MKKILKLALALIGGLYISLYTYDIAVSKALLGGRILIAVCCVIAIIIHTLGSKKLNKYLDNEILVFDDDLEFMMKQAIKDCDSHRIAAVLFAIIIVVGSFLMEIHHDTLFLYTSVYYFIILYAYFIPAFCLIRKIFSIRSRIKG